MQTARKVILSMQVTLDGFIEGPNGEVDWILAGDDEWEAMFNFLESVDTFLVGRKMYPGYAGYWRSVLTDPSGSANERRYAQLAEKAQHIVFSNTISTTDWANTRVAGDLEAEVTRLKKQPGNNIVAWGGATLASALINSGLVDEYRLTLNPTLLGSGKALFNNLEGRRRLQLTGSLPMSSGNIVLTYQPV